MTRAAVNMENIVETVRRDGAGVWPDFLGGRLLDRLRHQVTRLAAGKYALHFPKSTRVWDLYRHGNEFLKLLTLPHLDAVLTCLLGEHYLLSDYSLNIVNPGQPIDAWHIDYPYNEMPHLVSGALLGVQCVLAIDTFTADNGATQFIPATHTPPRRPDSNPAQAHHVLEADPGTLLIMAASTWHRSGHNATDHPRAGILLSFVERWIRPMTGPPEPGPWSATPRLRLLLGQERPPETIDGVPITGTETELP